MINKKNKKVLGVSILEALVSTVIIGIGFVAILQMTNYSVQSMQTSGDRTKANYLTNVIAEDVISSRRETTGAFDNFSNYVCKFSVNNFLNLFGLSRVRKITFLICQILRFCQ